MATHHEPPGENAACHCAQWTARGRSTRIHGLAENRVVYAVVPSRSLKGLREHEAWTRGPARRSR